VDEICEIEANNIFLKGKQQKRVKVRSLFCCWAVPELGISLTELAKRLGISAAGVGYSQHDKRRSRRRRPTPCGQAMAGQVAQGTGKQQQFHQLV